MRSRCKEVAKASMLVDGGPGVRFESAAGACFAVRCDGRVVAYRNACPHTGGELDWNEGDFHDAEGRYLVCATHGALFEPGTGRCIAGPCCGDTLEAVAVHDDGVSVIFTE